MSRNIETIPGPEMAQEAALLKELYEVVGAGVAFDGVYKLPAPKDPDAAAKLNEQAIAILRSQAVVYKRDDLKPADKPLQQAFKSFQRAALLNLGVTAECLNYGCCCYYMNLVKNGRMFFNLILDQTKRDRKAPAFEAVLQYFAAFYNYVVLQYADSTEHATEWWYGKVAVNPDFFMSRNNPTAGPPDRPVVDPDLLL